ncbi:MAG TPA: ABC transporter ATP-binding protein [Pirellulales bacterium]|nr:ABC transporter ATP-binding protein [Pirellulales bacterium]
MSESRIRFLTPFPGLGLLRPDSGKGTVLGVPLEHAGRQLRARLGYMPEAAATVATLKGVEYVAFSGDLYGMPHRDARRRAHEVLGYVGLGELRYRRLDEYSTGNLQRLKLAAALVHDPQLLLLDEPTNGLDPAGRQAMLKLLEDLIAETQKSLILCTHLLSDVQRLCQQIVVIHRGSVVRSGTMQSLRADLGNRYQLQWRGPADAFLAGLAAGGVEAGPATGNKVNVVVPHDWRTVDFFRVAERAGAVITHLNFDEENLERLFLRITEKQ